jgi:hypothetical protein
MIKVGQITITTRNAPSITAIRKKEGDHWAFTNQKSALISMKEEEEVSAPMETIVRKLTIELKNSTIQTSIRLNFVRHF